MSDTNDPQAPYGKNREAFGKIMDDALAKAEAAERAPLLSDGQMNDLIGGWGDGGWKVRDFYESKITSGELRVMKEVEVWHPSVPEEVWRKWINDDHMSLLVTKCCSRNPHLNTSRNFYGLPYLKWLCPGCGAQIVK